MLDTNPMPFQRVTKPACWISRVEGGWGKMSWVVTVGVAVLHIHRLVAGFDKVGYIVAYRAPCCGIVIQELETLRVKENLFGIGHGDGLL